MSNAFAAKLIKAKKEFPAVRGGESRVGECGNFMQIYFSPNTMLVIDLRKIKTCSPLICIICPVCLVKGFSRRETFHSRPIQHHPSPISPWPKIDLPALHCWLWQTHSVVCLTGCVYIPYTSLFSQANILPMSGLTAKKKPSENIWKLVLSAHLTKANIQRTRRLGKWKIEWKILLPLWVNII